MVHRLTSALFVLFTRLFYSTKFQILSLQDPLAEKLHFAEVTFAFYNETNAQPLPEPGEAS